MYVTHLFCSACGEKKEPNVLYNLCECGKPLIVEHDLDRVAETLNKESFEGTSFYTLALSGSSSGRR